MWLRLDGCPSSCTCKLRCHGWGQRGGNRGCSSRRPCCAAWSLLDGAVTIVPVGVHVLVVWLVDCQEQHNGGGELLDLGCHCSEFDVLALVDLAYIGSSIIVSDGTACNFGNLVLDLVANVSHVVGAVLVVVPCCSAATVLDVHVVGLDSRLEMVLGPCVVSLDGGGLVFPFHHLGLV